MKKGHLHGNKRNWKPRDPRPPPATDGLAKRPSAATARLQPWSVPNSVTMENREVSSFLRWQIGTQTATNAMETARTESSNS